MTPALRDALARWDAADAMEAEAMFALKALDAEIERTIGRHPRVVRLGGRYWRWEYGQVSERAFVDLDAKEQR